MTKHTKEPWLVQHPHAGIRGWEIADSSGLNQVSQDVTEDNARRIVACVNFCAGISTENLEGNEKLLWLAEQYNAVKLQRDELLAALDEISKLPSYRQDECSEMARDATVKAKGV